jgi:hypothetical protein
MYFRWEKSSCRGAPRLPRRCRALARSLSLSLPRTRTLPELKEQEREGERRNERVPVCPRPSRTPSRTLSYALVRSHSLSLALTGFHVEEHRCTGRSQKKQLTYTSLCCVYGGLVYNTVFHTHRCSLLLSPSSSLPRVSSRVSPLLCASSTSSLRPFDPPRSLGAAAGAALKQPKREGDRETRRRIEIDRDRRR